MTITPSAPINPARSPRTAPDRGVIEISRRLVGQDGWWVVDEVGARRRNRLRHAAVIGPMIAGDEA
jgi:hypothetical protein